MCVEYGIKTVFQLATLSLQKVSNNIRFKYFFYFIEKTSFLIIKRIGYLFINTLTMFKVLF